MPTLEATTRRLSLNQSSQSPLKEDLSGGNLTLFQGVSAQIKCALFDDTPSAANYISDLTNIDEVHLVVRKNSVNGGILFSRTVDASEFEVGTTYAAWLAETGQQFTFEISKADTTQNVPGSGKLTIYWVVTVVLDDGTDYIAGYGFGEIQDVGYVENPLPATYEEGVTPVRGAKLFTPFDANNFPIVNLPFSGVEYLETGSVVLVDGQLEAVVEFLYEKIAANYIFTSLYVRDTSVAPQDIRAVVNAQSTTGFTIKLSAAPNTANCTLVWNVAILDPTRAAQPGTSGPRYAIVPPQGDPVRYQVWDMGGSFYTAMAYKTGGATDAQAIQAAIDAAQENSYSGPVVLANRNWVLDEPLVYNINRPLVFRGEGAGSRLLWAHGGNLFECSIVADGCTFENLVIAPGHIDNKTHSVFAMPFGAERKTSFRNIITEGHQGDNYIGNVIDMSGGVSDSVYIEGCHFSEIAKTAVKIRAGSTIFINSCNFTAGMVGSKGLDLQGAFGGLYVVGLNTQGFDVGIHIHDTGPGSNREVSLINYSPDFCIDGVWIEDDTTVIISNVGLASCKRANLRIGGGASHVTVNGGYITNAGTGGLIEGAPAHGILMSSGYLILNGVDIRSNKSVANPNGVGLKVIGGASVKATGCGFEDNYRGFDISGVLNASVVDNTFYNNVAQNLRAAGLPQIYQLNLFSGLGNEGETDDNLFWSKLPNKVSAATFTSAAVSIPNNEVFALPLNSEDHDTSAIHSTVSNPERLVVPIGQDGTYKIEARVEYAPNVTGIRATSIRLNGVGGGIISPDSRNAVTNAQPTAVSLDAEIDLVGGQYVVLCLYQDTGAPLNALAGAVFKMRRVR